MYALLEMMFTTRVSSSVGTILSSLDEQKIIYLIRIRSMKKKKKKKHLTFVLPTFL